MRTALNVLCTLVFVAGVLSPWISLWFGPAGFCWPMARFLFGSHR